WLETPFVPNGEFPRDSIAIPPPPKLDHLGAGDDSCVVGPPEPLDRHPAATKAASATAMQGAPDHREPCGPNRTSVASIRKDVADPVDRLTRLSQAEAAGEGVEGGKGEQEEEGVEGDAHARVAEEEA